MDRLSAPRAGVPVYTLGGLEFVRIPAGTFLMGSTADNPLARANEKPQRCVDIPYDFWLTRFLVTNEQYSVYVGTGKHPVAARETKRNHPVVNVSWKGAMAYCDWLGDRFKEELPKESVLRLPTEPEWEKAAAR